MTAQEKEEMTWKIVDVCSNHFGINKGELFKKNRKYHVKVARFLAMHLMYHKLKYTLKEIGTFFNGRDHTTVLWAIRMVDTYLDEKYNYSERFDYKQILDLL